MVMASLVAHRAAVRACGGLNAAVGLSVPQAGCAAVSGAAGRGFGPVIRSRCKRRAAPRVSGGVAAVDSLAAFVQVTALLTSQGSGPIAAVKQAVTCGFAVISRRFSLQTRISHTCLEFSINRQSPINKIRLIRNAYRDPDTRARARDPAKHKDPATLFPAASRIMQAG